MITSEQKRLIDGIFEIENRYFQKMLLKKWRLIMILKTN